MSVVLGLDTSCYVTSLALVGMDGQVLLNARTPLKVELGQRGLMQSEAVFAHVRNIPALFAECAEALAAHPAAAVAASTAPRPGPDAYMPVFRVGEGHGKVYAQALGVPFFHTNHQDGHIAAARIDSGLEDAPECLALHLSGGTTELLLARGAKTELLGGSQDMHAGQLVDRLGVALGCPFPAGPHLEALAREGKSAGRIGVSVSGVDCHLSGAEAQALRMLSAGEAPADIAAEIYDFLARTVLRLLAAGAEQTGVDTALLAGGVASSALLRQQLLERAKRRRIPVALHFARPELSGDNAVGVAWIGLQRWREGKK